jgi:carboxylesterase type B
MNSGSLVPALPVNHAKPQAIYDHVVSAAGCSSASNPLTCLRGVSYDTFLAAANSVPGIFSYTSLDLSYLPRPDPHDTFYSVSPEVAVANGNFAKVPVIVGDQEDEGTLFSLVTSNISTTAELVTYLQSYFPLATQAQIEGLVATYPDSASAGSPFNTGALNELYPEFKRLSAILGDLTFTLTRRAYLNSIASSVPAWSYLGSYLYGTPILGTFHGSDLLEIFFDIPNPLPSSSILTYYVSFINNLNPNSYLTLSTLVNWPQWTTGSPKVLNFQALLNQVISDDFRSDSYNSLSSIVGSLRV